MERKIELLDCTLRDGGYINDWLFGHDKILTIFERLVSSGVDYIEIGFLDERRQFDMNRTIMPDTNSANKIFKNADKGNSTVLAMIDYGTCSIENLQPCDETFIDGIRVIFKEHKMYEALEFCRQVKNLGYKVFAQMVSVTTYSDSKLVEYAQKVNEVMPFATSMVDTYGLLDSEKLLHIAKILDKHLDKGVRMGFHAHNNFQLGYSNAIAFLNLGTAREGILVDGTLYGMGKSAGNAPLELLMMYMNERFNSSYDVTQVLEAVDSVILDIYRKQYWGYNLFFYVAASTHCHPNYVSYLMSKQTLSIKQILEILNSIEFEKKLMYDAKYVENLYLNYQSIKCDDSVSLNRLREIFKGEKILVLGPGNNIQRQSHLVENFIQSNDPLIISVNYAPKKFKVDYIFLTNTHRYNQLLYDLHESINFDADVIATSNVTKVAKNFKFILNYSSLIDSETTVRDNSLVMLLKAMMSIGIKKIYLAGFDGYSSREDNYFDVSREYSFVKEKADYLNSYVRNFLNHNADKLTVNFITQSRYEQCEGEKS